MLSKDCPDCGFHFTPRRWMHLRTPLGFACPSCGSRLAINLKWAFAAVVIQALFLAAVLTAGFRHPWYFLLTPVAVAASFLAHYGLFEVVGATPGPAGRRVGPA